MFKTKALENTNHVLFDILVPGSGASSTLEGEILRAYNRLAYRFYNDGDYVHTGYGIETAGSAWIFLNDNTRDSKITSLLKSLADEYNEGVYESILKDLGELIIKYITGKIESGNMTKNTDDYLDYYNEAVNKFGDPNADDDDEEDEEDWDDEDYQ